MESKISIPKPCNENWSAMSPNKKGRFCNSCDKTVIDFTKMNNPQILKYFSENSNNGRICGHFKLGQIENEESSKYNILKNRFNRIQIKPIKSVALFSLSLLFSLSSCMGKARIESESALNRNDSINENDKFVKKNVEVKNDSTTIERKQIKQ